MKRRNRGPRFTQLQTVPGPAHLRGPRASTAAGQILALPQHQRHSRPHLPSPLAVACGCPLSPTGSRCPRCGWTGQQRHRACWEEPLPRPNELTRAGTAGPQSLFLYFVQGQAWTCTLQPKGPETQQAVPRGHPPTCTPHLAHRAACTECHFAAAGLLPIKVSVTQCARRLRRRGGGACVEGGACCVRYPSNGPRGLLSRLDPAAPEMEPEVWDASNPFTIEGDHLIPDLDLYDADIYDVPDPGLLNEEDGEVARPRPPDGPLGRRPHSSAGSVLWEMQHSPGSPLT